MVTTNERSPIAINIVAVAAICATAPSITHGQNPQPGRGSGTSVPSIRPMRKISANGKPNRNRTCVAPTVPSVACQLALHGVAQGLKKRRDDREYGPEPTSEDHAAFSATTM